VADQESLGGCKDGLVQKHAVGEIIIDTFIWNLEDAMFLGKTYSSERLG
jgi:hypothetical protein